MNFLTAIINALVGFVQRNPLTVLVILILAIAAPALLKGVALFFLYVVMSILILAVALILVFRWRMNKVRRQMEEQFGEGFDPRNFGGQGFGSPFAGEPRKGREGEVKVRKTSGAPPRRVGDTLRRHDAGAARQQPTPAPRSGTAAGQRDSGTARHRRNKATPVRTRRNGCGNPHPPPHPETLPAGAPFFTPFCTL